MEKDVAWVALNMARGLDRVCVHGLIEEDVSVETVFENRDLFARVAGRSGAAPAQLLELANEEIERASRHGARLLTYESEAYPDSLRQIYDPPLALCCLGLPLPSDALSIVGSRNASHYGVGVARAIAREIAASGVPVVSGLARGIDTAAHLGALEGAAGSEGFLATIAVLGSGLNQPYPRENKPLIEKIARCGSVISEFPMDTRPAPMNFPMRNRIIAGLGTRGTLVVEAARRSGALITARLASDQGREVFAVPGNITSPTSAGANNLIQMGAKLVGSAADILGEQAVARAAASAPQLEGDERAVFEKLSADVPVHVDSLAANAEMPPSRLLSTLLALELKNRVTQLPGRFFLKRL